MMDTGDCDSVFEKGKREFDYSMIDRVVDTILEHCNPDLIFLFGSTAKGTAKYGSDIDILVVMDTDEKPMKRGMDILETIDVDATVDLIVMTPEEFMTNRADPRSFTNHILSSGRPIYGTVWLQRSAEDGER